MILFLLYMEYHHKIKFYLWILFKQGERDSKCHILWLYLLGRRQTLAQEAQQEPLFNLSFRHFNQSSSGVQETWWNACYVETFFSKGFFIIVVHTVLGRQDAYKYLYNTAIKWYIHHSFTSLYQSYWKFWLQYVWNWKLC